MKLIMIGALGNMLGPSAKHLSGFPKVKVLRILDRGTQGQSRDQFRVDWRAYGADLVPNLAALIGDRDFDGIVICAGKNGDDIGLIQALVESCQAMTSKPFILHLSTISCQFVRQSFAFCAKAGIDYANYPLTGGALGALNASMLILASGLPGLYQRLTPFLEKIGKPKFLGEEVDAGATSKLLGHVLVFNGLMGISSALNLHAHCQHKTQFFPEQAVLFDFLNQGAGGTRQWEVALKPGVLEKAWERGFLLKHAAVDLIYVLQLMLDNHAFPSTLRTLFELAYSFVYILRQGGDNFATQVIADYWLDPAKSKALAAFLAEHFNAQLTDVEQLNRCVALLPAHLQKTVLLDVVL